MASMNTVSIGFDRDSLNAIADLKSAVAYLAAYNSVQSLVSACHGLRISYEHYSLTTLDGKHIGSRSYVQVPAEFFREMLNALAELQSMDEEDDGPANHPSR